MRFRNLADGPAVEWWVQWNDRVISHVVTVRGKEIGGITNEVTYDAGATQHEHQVFNLLLLVLDALTRPA